MTKKLSVALLLALAAAQAGAALVTLNATVTAYAYQRHDAWGLTQGSHSTEFALVYDNATAADTPGSGLYRNAVQSLSVRIDGGAWLAQTISSGRIAINDSLYNNSNGTQFTESLNFSVSFASPGASGSSFIDFDLASFATTSLAGDVGALSDNLLTSLDATRFAGFQNNTVIANLHNPAGSSYGSSSVLIGGNTSFSMTTDGATQDVPEPASITLAGIAIAAAALGSCRRRHPHITGR